MTSRQETQDRPAAPRMLWVVSVVFLPFASGYFLSYLYRTVNSVIGEDLRTELGLDASDLGLLTAAYLIAFASFQLPLGVLLDRYSPRRVQSVLLLVAALGAFVFSRGDDLGLLITGRALIGFGVSGALMASFKSITLWFPKERWPLVNGCLLAIGGLGAVTATEPVEVALSVTDWRGVFVVLSIATIAVAGLIFLIVPERDNGAAVTSFREQFAGTRRIFTDRLFWTIAPMVFFSLAANLAILTLWEGPWLRDVADFTRQEAAVHLRWTMIAMTVGFVGTGLIADWLNRRGVGLVTVMTVGLVFFAVVQLLVILEVDRTGLWPWLLFGLLANVGVIGYAALSQYFPIEYAGRANTSINVLGFVAAFAAQFGVGAIIDLWPRPSPDSYNPDGYPWAFAVLLALQVLAFLWYLIMRRRTGKAMP